MVYPEFIRYGTCAVLGACNFFDPEQIVQHSLRSITEQTRHYLEIVAETKSMYIYYPDIRNNLFYKMK